MSDIMPRLIAVTEEEAQTAQRIASRLRKTARMHSPAPGTERTTISANLYCKDMTWLLTWLDHLSTPE